MHEVAYSGGLARPLICPESALAGLKADALAEFVARNYTPSRMVLAAAGLKEVRRLLWHFNGWVPGRQRAVMLRNLTCSEVCWACGSTACQLAHAQRSVAGTGAQCIYGSAARAVTQLGKTSRPALVLPAGVQPWWRQARWHGHDTLPQSGGSGAAGQGAGCCNSLA